MNRRMVLAASGAVLAGGAGCLEDEDPDQDPDPAENDAYVRPDDDPETVPPELVCDDDEFERRSGWIDEDDLQWGDLTDEDGEVVFELRTDSLEVSRGEDVTFTLRNVSGAQQETGNIHKANFDVYTEAGWQDPRGWPDGVPKPITDELWTWSPGESHEVTFEMTEQGVVDGAYHAHHDDLVTCPDLPPGRYRFATAAPDQGDVAVAFDLVE
ncbi:hypothetical protein AArcSl_1338 [Halalkaliarchaeum desulfuricum]|uniref:Uncharacterized protein n=1 Tax=Halalkaliarchaeum desulfuricum TaxID=2055893 RepID=A0A343TIP7_9EURY|nr:hypothetical protein [Halalkaliarchaeum desulfuricum]AUX08969.1 hypothetical protein AArcSl_1338 [Halalkaliarchaeum desulfuricum]